MARSADAVKRQAWRERLQRFQQSRSTVAAFCQAEGVSIPSFYQWRRTLGESARASAVPTAASRGVARQSFVPIEVVRATTIDIHLPNGARLAVPAGDRAALEAAVVTVARLPRVGQEVEPC